MLYITSRNKVESVTAYHVLNHDRSSDGGHFVPLQLPSLDRNEISALAQKSFGQIIADILNLFFSARLDGWDVDFSIGRYPVRLVPLNQKIYVAEAWHNPDRNFSRMVRNLSSRICGNQNVQKPTDWAWTAVRIAVLFAEYGQMLETGILQEAQLYDICVNTGDFTLPVAAWYAKKMGLPIRSILCACSDHSVLWDFLRTGNLQTSLLDKNDQQDFYNGFEQLIFSCFGFEETANYLYCCRQRAAYCINKSRLDLLCNDFRASVVSSHRITSVTQNVYNTAAYLFDPDTALAYACLQDARTSDSSTSVTLLLSEQSPVLSDKTR